MVIIELMNTKFFTGVGDAGESGFGQKKISKDDVLFGALGALDAVNALSGWSAVEASRLKEATPRIVEIESYLREIQEMLFIAQAEVASIGLDSGRSKEITPEKIERLEEIIQTVDTEVPPIEKFIIPGASELESRLDIARVETRSAERALIRFGRVRVLPPDLFRFMNRLSSTYFALARFANVLLRVSEKNPLYK